MHIKSRQPWLFNFCPSFQFRKGGLIKGQDQGDAGDANRDEYNWPLCTNGESHPIRKLLLAQVIPKNELLELAHKVHHLRNQLGLNQFCHQLEDFAEAYSLQKISESKVTVRNFCIFFVKKDLIQSFLYFFSTKAIPVQMHLEDQLRCTSAECALRQPSNGNLASTNIFSWIILTKRSEVN